MGAFRAHAPVLYARPLLSLLAYEKSVLFLIYVTHLRTTNHKSVSVSISCARNKELFYVSNLCLR